MSTASTMTGYDGLPTQVFKRLRYRFGVAVGRAPSVYFGLYRTFFPDPSLLVDRTTDLVIEGYPRSANTFAAAAFQMSQPKPLRLAHHVHSAAQILRAAKLGIPTLLVVRRPEDAVVSWIIREQHLTLELALWSYAVFHETALRVSDSYVVGRFESITNDFGSVIQAVNERFGKSFTPFEHTEEQVARCFERIDQADSSLVGKRAFDDVVARPSAGRNDAKKHLKEQLLSQRHVGRLSRANDCYDAILNSSHVI